MSDIFASLAAGTARPTGATTGETAVRVVDPSPDLARLTTGENLRGTVVGKDDHGHLMIRTRLGVLQLAAPRALPVGSEVVLQVRSVGPQVMMNLLPVDGSAGAQATGAQTALPVGPAKAAPQALPPNPHDLVQTAKLLRGVLHAAPPVPSLAGLPTAQPGAELLVRILALGVQSQAAVTPAAQSQSIQGSAPQGAVPQGPTAGGALPAGGAQAVPPHTSQGPASQRAIAQGPAPLGSVSQGSGPQGPMASGTPAAQPGTGPQATGTGTASPAGAASSPAGLRLAPQTPVGNSGHSVASVLQQTSSEAAARAAGSVSTPQQSAAPAGDTPSTALRITGLVTATTSNGQPIVHTPLGALTLDTRAALPPGSSLALQVTLPATQGTPTTPAAQALAAAWPSVETLEETLFQGLQPAQAEAVARALPQVGPRLASGLLFFLTALNQGNAASWMAPALAAEQGEQGDLFERLGREFAGLNRAIETPAGEWRFVNLPLWSEQGLRELRCFFRHQDHGGGGKDGDGEKATRFVLELELERHGELQLDGLVRAQRFDLLLRSRRALPALVRGDLMALFEEANAIAGYNGQLVFQASSDWLQLLAAQSEDRPHDGLNV
ncbi:MAG: hypothetical protein Tsb0032_14080 [Kiloniellaceae bacterium]